MRKIALFIIFITFSSLVAGCDVPLTSVVKEPIPLASSELLLEDQNYDRLFSLESKKTLTIEVTRSDYEALNQSMQAYYMQFGSYKDDEYIPSNVTYQDDLGVIAMDDVAFRTRGNLSRRPLFNERGEVIPNHFKLKFNRSFENISRNPYLFGLEELDLKYNRNYDPTYLNELGSLQLYEAFEVYAQKATLVHVYLKLDDTLIPIGVMTAFEPVDEWFIARRFEGADANGDLYKVLWQQSGPSTLASLHEGSYGIKDVGTNFRPGYDLKTNKNTSTHLALKSLVEALNHPDALFVNEAIETYFDMDYLARYFAVSFALGNPDDFRSMGNNYYLYHAPLQGKYYIIPYDLDHSLGQGWGGEPVFQDQLINTTLYHRWELLEHLSGGEREHPMIEHLFKMDAFRNQYEAMLLDVVKSETFSFQFFNQQIIRFESYYEKEVSVSLINAPFGPRNLSSFIEGKTQSILRQLNRD